LLANTEVKCWGVNGSSQLGDSNTTYRTTAVKVEGLGGKVTQLAAGAEHTCALLESGTIQCWGYAADGRIGDGTGEARTTPMAIPGLSSGVDAIAVGAAHGCALVQGDVKCFGINYANQIGTSNGLQPRAIVVPGLTLKATAIGAGDFHSCAALSDGTVSCWGDPGGTSPTKVEGLDEAVVSLSLGYFFACGLYSTTGVECWGNSDQLPDPPNFFTSGVVQVSTGRDHGCALLEDSVVKCWSSWGDIRVPFTVTGFAGEVQSIAAGEGDSCALLVGGTVQCWDTRTYPPYVLTTVHGFAGTVTGIDVGRDHACALLEGGTVQCWGSNNSGQLGTGDIAPRTQPTTVVGLSNVQAISAGELITCALLQGGAVQCWGSTKALDAIRLTPTNVLWD
jgi:alpha-tubulin suppressor-like RCC1 family protein